MEVRRIVFRSRLPLIAVLITTSISNAFALSVKNENMRLITNKMCPYAQKAWIALEVKGVPYTMDEISLYGPNGKPDWFWKLNPRGTVPVLVDGEHVLADSELILDHVMATTGETVRDDDDGSSRSPRWWRNLVATKLAPVGKQAVLRGGGTFTNELRRLLTSEIEEAIVASPYLCGEEATTADCCAFPFLWRIDNEFGIHEDELPKLRKWLDHCSSQEAFRKTIQRNWWWWW